MISLVYPLHSVRHRTVSRRCSFQWAQTFGQFCGPSRTSSLSPMPSSLLLWVENQWTPTLEGLRRGCWRRGRWQRSWDSTRRCPSRLTWRPSQPISTAEGWSFFVGLHLSCQINFVTGCSLNIFMFNKSFLYLKQDKFSYFSFFFFPANYSKHSEIK